MPDFDSSGILTSATSMRSTVPRPGIRAVGDVAVARSGFPDCSLASPISGRCKSDRHGARRGWRGGGRIDEGDVAQCFALFAGLGQGQCFAIFIALSDRLPLRASARAATRNPATTGHRKSAGALGAGGSRGVSLRDHGGWSAVASPRPPAPIVISSDFCCHGSSVSLSKVPKQRPLCRLARANVHRGRNARFCPSGLNTAFCSPRETFGSGMGASKGSGKIRRNARVPAAALSLPLLPSAPRSSWPIS